MNTVSFIGETSNKKRGKERELKYLKIKLATFSVRRGKRKILQWKPNSI